MSETEPESKKKSYLNNAHNLVLLNKDVSKPTKAKSFT